VGRLVGQEKKNKYADGGENLEIFPTPANQRERKKGEKEEGGRGERKGEGKG